MAAVEKEIEKLREQIRVHDYKYYVEAEPVITDLEYDKLMNKLKKLESDRPDLVTPESPTQRVGGQPIEGFETVPHRTRMLSIDNTYSEEELREFDTRLRKVLGGASVEYVVELKIDGVAISLIYEHGVLTQALTRGDGIQGDDVTSNVRTIQDVPLKLPTDNPPPLLEARGEIYMDNNDLAKLNKQMEQRGKNTLANARNATSGSMKLLDPSLCAARPLRCFIHSAGVMDGVDAKTHIEFLDLVHGYGLRPTPFVEAYKSMDAAIKKCEEWIERTHDLDFEIDGLVLKANCFDQREQAGTTAKAPRWVIAYKFEKYEAVTTLNAVTFQMGKAGTLTPVAELEPVQIAGTTVSRASLHNFEEVKRKDIRVGDTVVVEKAGKIIPHVVRVEEHLRTGKEKRIRVPSKCPICPNEKIRDLERDEGGTYVRCLNLTCQAKLKEKLEHYAGRSAMDVDGLGESLIEMLVDEGMVKSYGDLYRLTELELISLPRVGKKSATNLLNALEGSKSRDVDRLLTGLAISHVGRSVSALLADTFGTVQAIQQASVEELEAINEIGPAIAQSVHDYLNGEQGKATIEDLDSLGLNMGLPLSEDAEEEEDD
ncbi:MAG: NAD-dependent DNA ligase LigA, partial [Planctomycetales bacterium]